jgi:hypothetical protein
MYIPQSSSLRQFRWIALTVLAFLVSIVILACNSSAPPTAITSNGGASEPAPSPSSETDGSSSSSQRTVRGLDRPIGPLDLLPELFAATGADATAYPFDPSEARLIDVVLGRQIYLVRADNDQICSVASDTFITGQPSLLTSCTAEDHFFTSGLSMYRNSGTADGTTVSHTVLGVFPDGFDEGVHAPDQAATVAQGDNSVLIQYGADAPSSLAFEVFGSAGTMEIGTGLGITPAATESAQ